LSRPAEQGYSVAQLVRLLLEAVRPIQVAKKQQAPGPDCSLDRAEEWRHWLV